MIIELENNVKIIEKESNKGKLSFIGNYHNFEPDGPFKGHRFKINVIYTPIEGEPIHLIGYSKESYEDAYANLCIKILNL